MAKKVKEKKSRSSKKQELFETGVINNADYTHKTAIKTIIPWFREGLSDKEIIIKIMQEFPVKETSATTYLKAAKAGFNEEYILERKFNIIQHVRRYDKDILLLSKYEPRTSSYYQFQVQKTDAYLDMINLMQKKERVLGFHRKTQQIKIKNNINIAIPVVKQTFDFSQLTREEKLELYNFTIKSKINKGDKLELKPNQAKLLREKVETVDIIHEEIKEGEVVNVELINEKPEPIKSFDVVKENKEIKKDSNIIDLVGNNSGKDLESVKNNILGNLLK